MYTCMCVYVHVVVHAYMLDLCMDIVRWLVDSLCRDGADTPIVRVHNTNGAQLSSKDSVSLFIRLDVHCICLPCLTLPILP